MPGTLRRSASWLSQRIWTGLARDAHPRPVDLVADQGPHEVPVEWWYFVGQLDTEGQAQAERFAFELTLAKLSDPVLGRLSGWATLFSFIDAQRRTYDVEERVDWPPGSPLVSEGPPLAWRVGRGTQLERADDWVIEGYNGLWRLRARLSDGRGVDLDLSRTRPPVAFGDHGVVDYGGRERMAWVSETRMAMQGTVADGQTVRPVRGLCWMDHQWGAAWIDGYVWKVTSVHLDSGHDVLAFRMEDRAGRPVTAMAALISPDGTHVESRAVTLADLDPSIAWEDKVYRPTTRLLCPDLGLDLRIDPLFLDQRKRTRAPIQAFPIWWEGACDVMGTLRGAPVSGRAFVEIAGVE